MVRLVVKMEKQPLVRREFSAAAAAAIRKPTTTQVEEKTASIDPTGTHGFHACQTNAGHLRKLQCT